MSMVVVIPTLDTESEMLKACTASLEGVNYWVSHDEPRDGFAVACNFGAEIADDSDVLVFLNDDTIVAPGALEALGAAFQAPVPPAIAGSHLYYPDGSSQHSGVFLRRDAQGRLEAYNRKRPASSGPVPAVTGACLAIRRDVWDELGGFDESYRNGYEDVDLCLRARQAGHEVVFVAESAVVHLESQSPGRFDHAAENIALLNERWGDLPV